MPAEMKRQQRILASLAAVAWVAWKYGDAGDADDYVQTLLVARSLIENQGFHQRDLVSRYRSNPGYRLRGRKLHPGGVSPNYHGQLSKLLLSNDPEYVASDGVSDGSAMKVTPIAAAYADSFFDLIDVTDRITQVTHSSVEARLAAVMVALRLRQVLIGREAEGIEWVIDELGRAGQHLNFGDQSSFFLNRLKTAAEVCRQARESSKKQTETSADVLAALARKVGIEHLARSTPISAVCWSYENSSVFRRGWFKKGKEHIIIPASIKGGECELRGDSLEEELHLENVEHLRLIGELEGFEASHGYHWRQSLDTDTFFSVTASIVAARDGLRPIWFGAKWATWTFGDRLTEISAQLTTLSGNQA